MNWKHGRQGGAGLIEVMIAGLVMMIGLLGLMGLQINGKRSSFEAIQRTTAVEFTEDLLNRMRSNSSVIGLYATGGVGSGSLGKFAPTPDCSSAPCSDNQLATYDLWEWEQALDGASASIGANQLSGLVNPTGCIEVVNGSVTIAVAWQGTTDLDQTDIPSCGDGKYGTGDLRRQSLVIRTYIAPGI